MKNSVGNFYWQIFFKKSVMFFQYQTFFCTYLRNGWSDWCEKKVSTSVGYWVYYMTLTFELTHDLDLGFFKVKFRNTFILGIVGVIDVKWKGTELIRYCANCMTLPFDHTHDLDLQVSRSVFGIALSQEWDGWLTWKERDESSIHDDDIDFCSTMRVGWMNQIVTRMTSDVGVLSTYLVCVRNYMMIPHHRCKAII